jgi:UDP-N-acetylmuramyl pentapeptide synthase
MKKILVGFILWYLRTAGSLQLKKFNPYIVGVGGASGKTSLSNFIYLIFKDKYKTKQTKGKNSETGIPLDILGITLKNYSKIEWLKVLFLVPLKLLFYWEKVEVYVVEMGIDSPLPPKNMSYLLKIIKPDVGVLTNISYEHSIYFELLTKEGSESEKQKDILRLTKDQEGLLLTALSKNGVAVLNMDDENIKGLESLVSAQKLRVSAKDSVAEFYIEKIENYVDKFLTVFSYKGKKYKIEIGNPLPKHFAYSFVLALASSINKMGDMGQAISTLEQSFSLPPGRVSVFAGIKETVIIDSSYNNATLSPILDLLDFTKEVGKQRRRVAILGDMRELGTMSKALHEEVARKILNTLDFAILVGPLSEKYISPVLKKEEFPHFSFPTFTSARETILDEIRPKDIILVKGSQNTLFLERAVELLLKNKKDIELLCRRGEYWDKIRSKTL